jgi:hypothetical protein
MMEIGGNQAVFELLWCSAPAFGLPIQLVRQGASQIIDIAH